jgi:hypothetical protein
MKRVLVLIFASILAVRPAPAHQDQIRRLQQTLEICARLMRGLSQQVPAPAPAMPVNGMARKMMELAAANQLLNQNDQRLYQAGLFAGIESKLCVPVSFFNIFMAAEGLAGRPNYIPPALWLQSFVISYKVNADAMVTQQLSSVLGVQIANINLPAMFDGRYGAAMDIFLSDRSALIKGLGLTAEGIWLGANPDQALAWELIPPGLVMASVQFSNLSHAVVILGIDPVSKTIAVSDPDYPNTIQQRPYFVSSEFGIPILHLQIGPFFPVWAAVTQAFFIRRHGN